MNYFHVINFNKTEAFCGKKLRSKHSQSALGRKSTSGVKVLFTLFSKWINHHTFYLKDNSTYWMVYFWSFKLSLCLFLWVIACSCACAHCVYLWLWCTFRSQAPQMNTAHSQESSWSFPRWPAELLPVSKVASLPGPCSLAGRTIPGTWHIIRSLDKGATFGGHLSVLGPAVLSSNWGFTFVSFKNLARSRPRLKSGIFMLIF